MKLLTAINNILPKLGEHPVTRVDARHPTLAVILPVLEQCLVETLQKDWWFNRACVTLYPDSEGEIALPANLMSFLPDEGFVGSVRGSRLYNNGDLSFRWPGPVRGIMRERVEFEELPESVATYVFYYGLVTTYLSDIGLEPIVEQWKEMADSAEEQATQEHLKNARYSTQKSRRWGRLQRSLRG